MNEEIKPPVTAPESKPKVQEIPPPSVGPFAPGPDTPVVYPPGTSPEEIEKSLKAMKAVEISIPSTRMGAKGK